MKNKIIRIMPLGDSITAGYTDNPEWTHNFEYGYRAYLYQLLKEADISFEYVGQSKEPCNMLYGDPTHGGTVQPKIDLKGAGQDNHRGYGGWNIENIKQHIGNWLSLDTPDLILLMLGINGISSESPGQLDNLVKAIFEASKDVKLIVAQITPLFEYNQDIVDYNFYIRDTLIPFYAKRGYKIQTVDHYGHYLTDPDDLKSINPDCFSNELNHPSDSCYARIAAGWLRVIIND